MSDRISHQGKWFEMQIHGRTDGMQLYGGVENLLRMKSMVKLESYVHATQ